MSPRFKEISPPLRGMLVKTFLKQSPFEILSLKGDDRNGRVSSVAVFLPPMYTKMRRNLAINFKGRVQEGWLRGWRDWRLDVVDFCKMKMKKKEYVIISLLT